VHAFEGIAAPFFEQREHVLGLGTETFRGAGEMGRKGDPEVLALEDHPRKGDILFGRRSSLKPSIRGLVAEAPSRGTLSAIPRRKRRIFSIHIYNYHAKTPIFQRGKKKCLTIKTDGG